MRTRVISLGELQKTQAYGGLTANEKAAINGAWRSVPVGGFLSTPGLRGWLARNAGTMALTRASSPARSGAGVGQRSGVWRDPRLSTAAQKIQDAGAWASLPGAFADLESPLAGADRIRGSAAKQDASAFGNSSTGAMPWLENMVPPGDQSGVTEDWIEGQTKAGLGLQISDRLAERDANLAAWGEEVDSAVGGDWVPHSRGAELEGLATDVAGGIYDVVEVIGKVLEFVAPNSMDVWNNLGPVEKTILTLAVAGGAVGTALFGPEGGAAFEAAALGAGLTRDYVTARDIAKTMGSMGLGLAKDAARYTPLGPAGVLGGLWKGDIFGPAPTRDESEVLLNYFLGHLQGTPYAVRGLGSVERDRPHASPRSARPRPDTDDVAASDASNLRAGRPVSPAERLTNPADPFRGRGQRASGAPPSLERVDPRTIRPSGLQEEVRGPGVRKPPRNPV